MGAPVWGLSECVRVVQHGVLGGLPAPPLLPLRVVMRDGAGSQTVGHR